MNVNSYEKNAAFDIFGFTIFFQFPDQAIRNKGFSRLALVVDHDLLPFQVLNREIP